MVGDSVRTVAGLSVERSAVARFASAVFDPAAVFSDPAAARDAGHPAVPAPPTFTRVAYFPHNRPAGVGVDAGFDLGFDRGRTVHGEQAYEFERPVYVGDVLGGETELVSVFQRTGSGDRTLTFGVLETTYRDDDGDGETVLRERRTRIEVGSDGDAAAPTDERGERETGETGTDGARTDDGPWPAATVESGGGDAPTLRVGPLSRVDFARYAGASGDFNPLHLSDPAARAAGHRSVFAHGMLTAGVAARFARERVGLAALGTFETRFEDKVWPGDRLRVSGSVTEGDATDPAAISILVETGDGRTVLTGSATT
jgi:acyl dehydratase